jgi:excisionase family DNA binding protein
MTSLKNVKQAAALLGISPWTVRAYVRNGKLKPVRLGRRVLLEEAELERLITQGKNTVEIDQKSNENMGEARP